MGAVEREASNRRLAHLLIHQHKHKTQRRQTAQMLGSTHEKRRIMGKCLPAAHPARYFCINYPHFNPGLGFGLGSRRCRLGLRFGLRFRSRT